MFAPWNLPPPTDEDLDFEDPPKYVVNPHARVFWCFNKNVRNKILQNWPKRTFFCFHKTFCQFQVDEDPEISKARIENHFHKNPSHRINADELGQWRELAQEWRMLRDEKRDSKTPHKRRNVLDSIERSAQQNRRSNDKEVTRKEILHKTVLNTTKSFRFLCNTHNLSKK